MLENAPPRVTALLGAFSIIQLLSEPEGVKQLKNELKPLIDDVVAAHKQLWKRQREISEADKALQATQANHDRALSALSKKQAAASAATAALETAAATHAATVQADSAKLEAREAKLREERQQHRQDKQELAKARAELERDISELLTRKDEVDKRDKQARDLMAKAEAIRADYEGRVQALSAHLQQAQA